MGNRYTIRISAVEITKEELSQPKITQKQIVL